MSRFANLSDKPKCEGQGHRHEGSANERQQSGTATQTTASPTPSRVGRKAIAAYFSPEMSMAMHVCARKNALSLQALMVEAFDDVLRKSGERPIGG